MFVIKNGVLYHVIYIFAILVILWFYILQYIAFSINRKLFFFFINHESFQSGVIIKIPENFSGILKIYKT